MKGGLDGLGMGPVCRWGGGVAGWHTVWNAGSARQHAVVEPPRRTPARNAYSWPRACFGLTGCSRYTVHLPCAHSSTWRSIRSSDDASASAAMGSKKPTCGRWRSK